jgi:hypothetical protein
VSGKRSFFFLFFSLLYLAKLPIEPWGKGWVILRTGKERIVFCLSFCQLLEGTAKGNKQYQGFVAIRTANPVSLVVAFRGTVTGEEWDMNVNFPKKSLRYSCNGVYPEVHQGFESILDSLQLVTKHQFLSPRLNNVGTAFVRTMAFLKGIEALSMAYGVQRTYFTGHSFGGTFAVLATFDGVKRKALDPKKMSVVTFGQPRVGNDAFAKCFDDMQLDTVIRVVNPFDAVPYLPPAIFG